MSKWAMAAGLAALLGMATSAFAQATPHTAGSGKGCTKGDDHDEGP